MSVLTHLAPQPSGRLENYTVLYWQNFVLESGAINLSLCARWFPASAPSGACYEIDVRFKQSAVTPSGGADALAISQQRPQLLWDVCDSVAFDWKPPGMLPRTNGHLEVDKEKRCVVTHMVPLPPDSWQVLLTWSCDGKLNPHLLSLVPAALQMQIQLWDGRRVQHPSSPCFVVPLQGELSSIPAEYALHPFSHAGTTSSTAPNAEADLRDARKEAELLRVKKKDAEKTLADIAQCIGVFQQELASRPSRVEAVRLESKLEEEGNCRRLFQEEIMNLRGRIRIFCRIRPNEPNSSAGPPAVTTLSRREVFLPSLRRHFEFDLIFGPETLTAAIWEETWPLIDSIFEQPGTSACVMAYGQTGAGKTFTMDGDERQPGLIPLAIERLFKKAALGEVQISISMLEVYQEQLRDLLGTNRLTLRNIGGEGGPEIRELRLELAKTREEALSIYETGARLRHLGMSERNSRSSRSHLVLSFHVQRLDPIRGEVVNTSKISLVDLAGSERQSSGAAFDRSRVNEASVINNSLTSLSKVVQACVTRAASPRPDKGMGCHIPYRDSVLTQLLSDSIGGQGKTLVIVHVTQREEDVQESLRTLQFASNAACVQERSAARSEEERLQRQLSRLSSENQRLKEELGAASSKSPRPFSEAPQSARRHRSPKSPRPFSERESSRRGESRDESNVRMTVSSAVSSPRPGVTSQPPSSPSPPASALHCKLVQYSKTSAPRTTATHGGG